MSNLNARNSSTSVNSSDPWSSGENATVSEVATPIKETLETTAPTQPATEKTEVHAPKVDYRKLKVGDDIALDGNDLMVDAIGSDGSMEIAGCYVSPRVAKLRFVNGATFLSQLKIVFDQYLAELMSDINEEAAFLKESPKSSFVGLTEEQLSEVQSTALAKQAAKDAIFKADQLAQRNAAKAAVAAKKSQLETNHQKLILGAAQMAGKSLDWQNVDQRMLQHVLAGQSDTSMIPQAVKDGLKNLSTTQMDNQTVEIQATVV